jgi:uncharacterized protein (DUF488 family)
MQPSIPHYHRQRFLLLFLEAAGGKLTKIDLQKLLFLAHQENNLSYYDFVPYHYGCFSFQAASDLDLLKKNGWLEITKHQVKLQKPINYAGIFKEKDKQYSKKFFNTYKNLRGKALLQYVYTSFPYFAQNSKLSRTVTIKKSRPDIKGLRTLYTVGYEGLTFEAYANKLIENDVSVLCDIRRNPLSRKFGFSKESMSKLLPKLGISYIHIPELGIVSDKRRKLKSFEDYSRLFQEYCKELPNKEIHIQKVDGLLNSKIRVALTCFEHEPAFCHRSHLSSYIVSHYPATVKHL